MKPVLQIVSSLIVVCALGVGSLLARDNSPATNSTAVRDVATSQISPDAPVILKDEPGNAMILSTGDNLFFYKWFPIDSPAGIGASFDIFKSHYNVNRIIWRGAQAQWMAPDSVFRTEPEELFDLYKMEMDLETKDKLSHKGGEEAKKRGLAYWGYMPLFEVGADEEAVSMGGFGPYAFEESFRAKHPEFRLYDRAGITSGSTIEFGYPEVRAAWLARYEELLKPGGDFSIYEGVIFYTYVENFFPRYSDQFIYSDLAAKDFKAKYGVDVFTQPFDRAKFLELRGQYFTQYLRELRSLFRKYNKKLAIYIDAREPEIPSRWPSFPGILVPGEIKMEWKTWVKEGLVDELCLRAVTKMEEVQPFLDAVKGTDVRITLLLNRMPDALAPLRRLGISRHLWSPELAQDFPPQNNPASDIDSTDRIAVMSVLRQVRDGQLDIPVEKIVAMFNHPDLILRRQAVAAVLGRKMTEAIPALEKAASDPENSFRAVVIDALGTLHGPNSAQVIADSLEKYQNCGMRIVARTAWGMIAADRPGDLVTVYDKSKCDYVKLSLLELLVSKHAVPAIEATPLYRPIVEKGLADPAEHIRMMAAFALGYYVDAESAKALLKLTDDQSVVVQNAAIFSLGEVARRLDDRELRDTIFSQLVSRQTEYGQNSSRKDLAWGYRVVSEAILYGFGPRGHRQIVSRLNGDDLDLAAQAWRVLFHPNDGWNFYPVTPEQGESFYAYYPKPTRMKIERQKYKTPETVEVLTQNFKEVKPDAAGISGTAWNHGGKWSGFGSTVQGSSRDGGSAVTLGVDASGKRGQLIAQVAYDMPDGRFKNRLRGHFPRSPINYGIGDGTAELSLSVCKSGDSDSLDIKLVSDKPSDPFIGIRIAKDGSLQLIASSHDGSKSSNIKLAPKQWTDVNLQLDFTTGQAKLLAKDGTIIANSPFDHNKRYRAIVVEATGENGSSSQFTDVKLTQVVK